MAADSLKELMLWWMAFSGGEGVEVGGRRWVKKGGRMKVEEGDRRKVGG